MRLGQAVRPERLAAERPREKPFTLLVRPEPRDRHACERVDAHADGHARPRAGDLLEDLKVGLGGLIAPSVLHLVRQAEQSRRAEPGERIPREKPIVLVLVYPHSQGFLAELARELDEVVGFLAGQDPRGGHRRTSSSCCGSGP